MKTGLFFGTFNPIHTGHLIIAEYMLEFTDLSEIWFVVSPHNPLKEKSLIITDEQRLELVKLSLPYQSKRLKVSDVEYSMPQPSYTIDTLKELHKIHPNREFVVIMGSDSLETIEKWKDYKEILKHFEVYVYPRRKTFRLGDIKYPRVKLINAPVIDISSTEIREKLWKGKDMSSDLPDDVWAYILFYGLYRQENSR